MIEPAPHLSQPPVRRHLLFVGVLLAVVSLTTALALNHVVFAPYVTQGPIVVEVKSGMSVKEITQAVKTAGAVRSELVLYALITYFHDPKNIYAGAYVFNGNESTWQAAQKLAQSEIKSDTITLTFPEGISVAEMALIAKKALPSLDTEAYLREATASEGFLFPETYFVPHDYSAAELVALQKATYSDKIDPLRAEIVESGLTEQELVTLASVVEREANDDESRKQVAAILRHRLEINMPLQADATIGYVLNKPLSELQPQDLKIESPYNSYLNRGLPPTPIGNPGTAAIEAVLANIQTDYLYYITGNDGRFYYAKTYDEHLDNIELYLTP